MNILVINAGSSSLKYQLMNPDSGEIFAKGLCERIYIDGRLTHKVPAKDIKVTASCTAAINLSNRASLTKPASRQSATASLSARSTTPPT